MRFTYISFRYMMNVAVDWWHDITLVTHTTVLTAFGPGLPGYQKKHSPTHTHPDHRTSFISFLHLLLSTASSVFSLPARQSSLTTYLHVLLGLPLGLGPSTSYFMHFFTQSSSSFCNTAFCTQYSQNLLTAYNRTVWQQTVSKNQQSSKNTWSIMCKSC